MTETAALQKQNAERRARVAQLEAEVKRLRDDLADRDIQFPEEWDLKPQEAKLLRFLYTSPRGLQTKASIHRAISKPNTHTEPGIVTTIACKVRGKLKPYGIEIETKHRLGLFLPPASREIITQNLVKLKVSESGS